MVGGPGEQEGEGSPEGSEGCTAQEAGEAGLHKYRVPWDHEQDVPQDAEVIHARVCGGVVGHEEPEEDEDCVLETEREPVYRAPGGEVGDCAREDACYEHAEHETADDDGEGCCAAVGRGEVADEREHELGCYGCDGGYEGYCCENSEVGGDA